MNTALHIRNRVRNIFHVVALGKDVNEKNFLGRLEFAIEMSIDDEREKREAKKRLKLIENRSEKQIALTIALLKTKVDKPHRLFELLMMAKDAFNSGITETEVSEAIAAVTGHSLVYSPDLTNGELYELKLTSIPEFPSEKKCRAEYPYHNVKKRLK